MSGILMMVIAIVVLGGAYLLYGRYLQNKWGIDPKAKTPAYEMEDGVDYVPADTNSDISLRQSQVQARSTDQSRQQSSDGFRFYSGSLLVVYSSEQYRILHLCMHL